MKFDRTLIVRPGLASLLFVLAAGAAPAAQAEDAMYKCSHEDGRIEYTNKAPAPGAKGCVKLTVDPVVIPAPKLSSAAKSPSNFPKVDGDTQKARDSDRARILQEELKTQEARLAELKKTFRGGEPERLGDETHNYQKYLDRVQKLKEDIARAESDINSLRTELSRTQ